ncbi:MAG: helix-turn-helix domain-containing protein [Oscillospiraceae bacterium]
MYENLRAERIGDALVSLRKKAGLSQKELAEALAPYGVRVTNQAVSKWEKGLTQPSAGQLLALCLALGVEDISAAFGLGGSKLLRGLNDAGVRKVAEYADILRASGLFAPESGHIGARVLPLYAMAVSAGTGQFLDESDYESVEVGPEVPQSADFGVRVAGDSMEPKYVSGQTVWVHRQQTLSAGETGVFLYDDNVYLKVLRMDGEGVRLHSLNPAYPDIPIGSFAELRVLGKAVV